MNKPEKRRTRKNREQENFAISILEIKSIINKIDLLGYFICDEERVFMGKFVIQIHGNIFILYFIEQFNQESGQLWKLRKVVNYGNFEQIILVWAIECLNCKIITTN